MTLRVEPSVVVSRRRASSVAAAAVVAAVALTVAGCSAGPESQSPFSHIALRLLPEGGEESAAQAVFFDQEEMLRWRFASGQDLAPWTPQRIDTSFERRGHSLFLRSSRRDPALVRDCAIDAHAVKAIRVEASALAAGAKMRILWAARGEGFSEERMLQVSRPDPTGTLMPTYTFAVGGHELWRGEIGRFRLDPTTQSDRRVQLVSITGVDFTLDEDALQSVLARSWWVDLHGDARRAVLLPPGRPFVHELAAPARARLRFACGLPAGVTHPVRFRVTAKLAGATPSPLADFTVGPCTDECGWVEREVDLATRAGQRVQLRFETTSAEALDPFAGLPAVANIEVITREPPPRPRPNVLVVVLDTLRADRLSCYGYRRETTPRIDAWAGDNGVVFENVIAPAPWTLPSHVSLFTGLDALSHGMNTSEPVSGSLTTLAEHLRDAGYTTAAVTGGGYLATGYGLMQGFDTVAYRYDPKHKPAQSGNDIESGTALAVRWLADSQDRPFFLFFHTYETHAPYRAREPYFARFHGPDTGVGAPFVTTSPHTPVADTGFVYTSRLMQRIMEPTVRYEPVPAERLPLVQDLYDSTVAFADQHVGHILDRLRASGLDRDTIVVVTSDHGESLGERGLAGHSTLQECELKVPLIISAPGVRRERPRVASQVRLVDVAPTILDLVGLEPATEIDGHSLVPLLTGRGRWDHEEAWSYAASSNFGISLRVANRIKYKYRNSPWPPIRSQEELYRIDIDPSEEHNLAPEHDATEVLRQRTSERFRRSGGGLVVTFANHEERPLHGVLRGRIVNPLRVKTVAVPEDRVGWDGVQLLVTLPPGESVTLYVEGTPFGELKVVAELDPGRPPGLEHVLDLDRVNRWLAVLEGKWRQLDEEPELDSTSVRISARADPASRRDRATVDSSVQDQLRQLGYLE